MIAIALEVVIGERSVVHKLWHLVLSMIWLNIGLARWVEAIVKALILILIPIELVDLILRVVLVLELLVVHLVW